MPRPSLLTSLLPSTSYLLAYVLPLLFLSLTLTFAGAFLTLDRTRSFAPSYDTLPKQRKTRWTVEGGVGGLAVGYVFGSMYHVVYADWSIDCLEVHVSSFLALLIPAISTSSALTPKSFFPIWLSSAIVTTLVSGRWKYCALAFSGISGG